MNWNDSPCSKSWYQLYLSDIDTQSVLDYGVKIHEELERLCR